MVLVPRMRLKLHVCAFVALVYFFFTWSIRQSTFILVPCYGRGWDALRGTAKNQRAAHVDGAIGQITKQHRRLQNWKAKHTHRERTKKNFSSFSICAVFISINTSWWWIGGKFLAYLGLLPTDPVQLESNDEFCIWLTGQQLQVAKPILNLSNQRTLYTKVVPTNWNRILPDE